VSGAEWSNGTFLDASNELVIPLGDLAGMSGRLQNLHCQDVRFLRADVMRLWPAVPAT
jgi:hypothetical protein